MIKKNNSIPELKQKLILVIIITLLFVALFILSKNLYNTKIIIPTENNVTIKEIIVLSYNQETNEINLAIEPSTTQERCAILVNEELEDGNYQDGKCYLTVDFNKQNLYFYNSYNIQSPLLEINDYIVDIKLDDKNYLALGNELNLEENLIKVGNPEISWFSSDGTLIASGIFTSNTSLTTKITGYLNNNQIIETEVISTNVITKVPTEFNSNKSTLTCQQFSTEEATLLDEILEYRIAEAGYQTRAGVVAAARFLTLEFPYKISYYWENGRLNNTGTHYVDGEGRYYHKGLYLDETKYDSIVASLFGPAMWGCSMVSYEDDHPYYTPGQKYSNGLDCSGFVSWALLNGGFDVGDRGAGDLPTPDQLTDLGDLKKLTSTLIKSGTIKVGDLLNTFGHIAIIIGQDTDNYYVAESLNTYKSLVVKTYSKKKVMNTFKYVVLMDDVYLSDGNLTDMWY